MEDGRSNIINVSQMTVWYTQELVRTILSTNCHWQRGHSVSSRNQVCPKRENLTFVWVFFFFCFKIFFIGV